MKILSIAILLCLLSQDSIMAQKQNNLPLIPLPEKLIIGNGNFEINESRNDVNKLINSINKIEGQVRDARLVDVSANRYFYFLLAALILLAIDVLFSVKPVAI